MVERVAVNHLVGGSSPSRGAISNRAATKGGCLFIMYFAYILQSETTGRYYIGSTDDVYRRLKQHNDPEYRHSKTTKRFKGPWKLVYWEKYQSRSEAMLREKQIKSWKSRKAIQELIGSQLVESR